MAHSDFKIKGFSSLAIHGGHETDPLYAHLTPIYASSTFVYDDAEQGMRRFSGKEKGYIYSRWGNPSFTEAENKIAAFEAFGIDDGSGKPLQLKAILHSSGMAAISSLMLSTLKTGDKLVSHYSLYGGTEEYIHRLLEPLQIGSVIVDFRDPNKLEDALKQDSTIKMVYIETPANPTIQCIDIETVSAIAKKHGKIVVCDNTFATPYLQQPFKYSVDFVIHSTTKFLNGHGTAIGGVLIGRDLNFMNTHATKIHRLLGGNSNPFDSFLLVNGMKTLEIRMDRHCFNAQKVAEFLESNSSVSQVNFNGLSSHPGYNISKKQMKMPGALLSFEHKDGLNGGISFMNKLKFCTRAISLGTCDTLLSHPASMSHFGVNREDRLKYGITDGLIRMSVGIENIEDILSDLDQALS